jgi:hypothetical protein
VKQSQKEPAESGDDENTKRPLNMDAHNRATGPVPFYPPMNEGVSAGLVPALPTARRIEGVGKVSRFGAVVAKMTIRLVLVPSVVFIMA